MMNNNYYAWVGFDNQCWVITEEYGTPEEVLNELKERYTVNEMHEEGFTISRIISDGKCWLEAVEDYEY